MELSWTNNCEKKRSNFSLLTNDVGPRIKLVLWAGLGGDQPGQCSTLFTVLVLDEASNLSIVRLPIFLICYLDHISCLVVYTLWIHINNKDDDGLAPSLTFITAGFAASYRINTVPCKIQIQTWWSSRQILVLWLAEGHRFTLVHGAAQ